MRSTSSFFISFSALALAALSTTAVPTHAHAQPTALAAEPDLPAFAAAQGELPAPPEPAALVAEDPLLWNEDSDGQTSYPSIRNASIDQEVADDFFLAGNITGIRSGGRANQPSDEPLQAYEVRFYDVAADGRPGALLAEYVLAADDPNLIVDAYQPGMVEAKLSPPFPATGQHFVGVQIVTDAYWRRPSNNTLNAHRGSHVWVKDNLNGGTWEVPSTFQDRRSDVSVELYGELTAPPTLTDVDPDATTPSGRLRIFGGNIGGTRQGGTVTVDGVPALIGQWTDRAIHAYVPEGTSGSAEVVVSNSVGASDPLTVQVSPREQQGRIKWVFTCDSYYVDHRVGIGPDGTVYAQDTEAIVYALSPDGGLRWLRDLGAVGVGGEGSEGPVAVGEDGTIFVGVNPGGPTAQIVALNPDGSTRWTYTRDDTQGLIGGPGVGADGNVYAVFDLVNSAVVSLRPEDGSVRWTHAGDPILAEHGQRGMEIGFASDRLYVAFDEGSVHHTPLIYGFSYSGSQLFAVPSAGESSDPVVASDDSFYLPAYPTGIQFGSYDADGSVRWVTDYQPAKAFTNGSVGPDDTVYSVRTARQLIAFEPDGTVRWLTETQDDRFRRPIVSPGGEQIVLAGSIPDPDEPYSNLAVFRSFDANGDPLWLQELPCDDDGAFLSADAAVRFSADGTIAYAPVGRNFNLDFDPHCYVYAFDTTVPDDGGESSAMIFADDFEGGEAMWSAMTP